MALEHARVPGVRVRRLSQLLRHARAEVLGAPCGGPVLVVGGELFDPVERRAGSGPVSVRHPQEGDAEERLGRLVSRPVVVGQGEHHPREGRLVAAAKRQERPLESRVVGETVVVKELLHPGVAGSSHVGLPARGGLCPCVERRHERCVVLAAHDGLVPRSAAASLRPAERLRRA